LSYAPAMGVKKLWKRGVSVKTNSKNIRAADAKEVGVGNPAEETYCYPNNEILLFLGFLSTDN